MKHSLLKNTLVAFFWDLWCLLSIIGIWPRFIEPKFLLTTRLSLKLHKPASSSGELQNLNLKIVQFSDLHYSSKMSLRYLNKIKKKINQFKPDLILFTGDLISYGILENETVLRDFLSGLKSTYGSFASLGNHDYEKYVSKDKDGNYSIVQEHDHFLLKSLERFKSKSNPNPQTAQDALALLPHPKLKKVLEESSFQLLENETIQISAENFFVNLTGLGDYWLGRFKPQNAFNNYNADYPGIVLSHNPDTFPLLQKYPGDLILAGHTHGGVVNLPFLWKYFSSVKEKRLKKGLFKNGNKLLYVNRGVGGHHAFRWFSPPELLFITIEDIAKLPTPSTTEKYHGPFD